jgi:hypothetical protein
MQPQVPLGRDRAAGAGLHPAGDRTDGHHGDEQDDGGGEQVAHRDTSAPIDRLGRRPPGPSAFGVSDGTRTRDTLDHNQVLYLLSYTHHGPE